MRTLNDYFLTGILDNISTASQIYIPCPDGGKIVAIACTINNAITVADSTLTIKVNTAAGVATAMTAGTLTIPFTGSAAGSKSSKEFTTGDGTEMVPDGGSVEVECGGSTTACKGYVVVTIRR
jgi:hypothetical protein